MNQPVSLADYTSEYTKDFVPSEPPNPSPSLPPSLTWIPTINLIVLPPLPSLPYNSLVIDRLLSVRKTLTSQTHGLQGYPIKA